MAGSIRILGRIGAQAYRLALPEKYQRVPSPIFKRLPHETMMTIRFCQMPNARFRR